MEGTYTNFTFMLIHSPPISVLPHLHAKRWYIKHKNTTIILPILLQVTTSVIIHVPLLFFIHPSVSAINFLNITANANNSVE